MNDAAIFLWLKSIKARLEKHGAASAVLNVDADDATGWSVNVILNPPHFYSPIRHEIKGGSILELMDAGNKWVENLNVEEEMAKRREEYGNYGNQALPTQTVTSTQGGVYVGSGGTIMLVGAGGSGGAGYASATGASYLGGAAGLQNTQSLGQNIQLSNQNAFAQAVWQQQRSAATMVPYSPVKPLDSATALKDAVDAAYDKMIAETAEPKTESLLKRLKGWL